MSVATWTRAGACAAAFAVSAAGFAQGLSVDDQLPSENRRKVVITSPGVFKAVVLQASGGGINEFYNLASDPEAKQSLPWDDRGLLEIGWHGKPFKNPGADGKTCCEAHATGENKPGTDCFNGCADWPSLGHKNLKAVGELAVIEQSPARVRVHAKAPFVWWAKYVHKLTAEAFYTFYPSGRIVAQIHVTNGGDTPFHWSGEYGPHLTVVGDDKNPNVDLGFEWSTPASGVVAKEGAPKVSEELVLAASEKTHTRLMLTIPSEEQRLFNRHMRHNGRSIGWDRMGYGSANLVMEPGYDNTWACMIEMSSDAPAAAAFKTAVEAVPFAADYRAPAKITGATLVTDDAGDFNKDGFNESEGCYVLKAPPQQIDGVLVPMSLSFTFEKGKAAGFAPAFKVLGWAGAAPKTVKVDGKDAPCAAGVVDGKLIVQILGAIAADKAQIDIRP